ncbi:hypothetical protein HDU84_005589 [Entophlyctis sp. JEL0112]|nr:hypothetical protein HDU84_005589 [Entophlyctis sp. JEL0112]
MRRPLLLLNSAAAAAALALAVAAGLLGAGPVAAQAVSSSSASTAVTVVSSDAVTTVDSSTTTTASAIITTTQSSANSSTSVVLVSSTSTTKTTLQTTTTTTTAAAATTSSAPSCISLAGSTRCPSYKSYYIDANSIVNFRTSGATGAGTVSDFDDLVDSFANGGPSSILSSAACSVLDISHIRYNDQFYCDYFLQDPYVIGGDANGASDCNVIMYGGSTRPSTLPRISNDTCYDYYNTVYYYISRPDWCVGTTISGRQTVMSSIGTICANAAEYVADLGLPTVNMANDTSSEHYNCGYGTYQGNSTESLQNAYDDCVSQSNPEACCLYDPNLYAALTSGVIPTAAATPTYSCQVVFNRFFTASCGQISGAVSGVILGIMSLVIVWWGIKQQDPNAMQNTASGKNRDAFKSWWNGSALSNANNDGSATGSATGAAYSATAVSNGAKAEHERSQFEHFGDLDASARRVVLTAPVQPQSHQYQQQPRFQPTAAAGSDPFGEMMGGGTMRMIPTYNALFEFRGVPGSLELDIVRAGDRLVVLEVKSNGYGVVRNLETGRQGLVPMNILTR